MMSPLLALQGPTFALSALVLVAKVSLILALGAVVAAALRRSSAAIRHLVWSLTLGGTVALLLLMVAAPPIVLRLPSTWTLGPANFLLERSGSASVPQASALVASSSGTISSGSGAELRVFTADTKGAAGTAASEGSHIASGPARTGRFAPPLEPSLAIIAVLWLLGCAAVLARCVLGHITVARIVGHSTALPATVRDALLPTAASRMEVQRPVQILVSDRVGTPVSAGVLHPVVLLPRDSATWTDERLRIVLMHELAHVARLDGLSQLVVNAACALFWFHPGVWIAAGRLRLEGEHAADDRVLGAGVPGLSYASHLLELARQGRVVHLSPAASLGVARPTHLEARFRAMLDTSRSRASVSLRLQSIVGVLAVVALIPVAGLRAELRAAPPGDDTSMSSVHVISTAAAEPAVVSPHTEGLRAPSSSIDGARTAPGVGSEPQAATRSRADSTFEQTLNAASGERLVLDLDTGGEVILHAWDEPRVRLTARLLGADWRETRVALERTADGVRLSSEYEGSRNQHSSSHRFELWVPRRFDVRLSSAGGDITIQDVEGSFRGQTGGGSIRIERAKGRASLSTGGGDIRVADSDLSGSVSTGGGTVVLSNITGGLRGSSSSGPVVYADREGTVSEPRGAGSGRGAGRGTGATADLSGVTISSHEIRAAAGVGPLHISKAGGAIVLDRAPRGGTISTGGGGITIGASGGMLDATTGGGDIHIRRLEGDARVSTGAGDVSISVTNADGTTHSIEVGSGSGQVVIELPAALNARFDLETAYTDTYRRRTRIESDWQLERDETTEWDRSEGSRRKYVRAHGTVGNGRGLIRIRTVNGDVTIRRIP